MHRHEQIKRVDRFGEEPSIAQARADGLIASMRGHFDDALVTGWEPLEGTFGLPDIDDEHVLAAAVVGGAGVVVTNNLKHFPPSQVPPAIQVLLPSEFAADTADVDPERAARAICEIAARRTKGPAEPRDLVELMIARYGMQDVAEIVLPILDDVELARLGEA